MPVRRTEYLAWAIAHYGDLRFNLASSGVRAVAAADLGPPPDPADTGAFVRLADAIAEREGWTRREVLATPGATGAMTLACAALLGPGNRVLVERPAYEPLVRIPEGFGAAVDRFDRRPQRGWALDAGDVEAAMRPGTKLVLVTEPHNPTGVLSPPGAIRAAAEAAERAGAVLLVNEVYRRFHAAPSARRVDPRILVADSVTKFEGAWWARGGWLGGPADIVARASDAQVTLSVAAPAGAAWAVAALARPALSERSSAFAAPSRRRILAEWIRGNSRLSWVEPAAGPFGLVRVEDPPDLRALAERLLTERGLLFAPGGFFEAPGWMRISWSERPERLEEALRILGAALDGARRATRRERERRYPARG